MKKYDVFGLGAALMDFLVEIEDGEFVEFELRKGEMHLIGEDESKKIMDKLNKYKVRTSPGGSSANVLAGVAVLGGKAVFCGKVGNDRHAEIYEEKSIECGVCSRMKRHNGKMTGHCITFITPDSERTFATHLGASMHLQKEDILDEDIAQSKIFHTDCYQLEDPKLREVALHAIAIAKKSGTMVSIDLADPALIRRNLKSLREIVRKNADIIFANENEAMEFTGRKDSREALDDISKICKIAVVKLGKEGSLIKSEGVAYLIPAVKANAVDTTGAGDMYAAGVLFGIANGIPLDRAGRIGSWAASKVVSQVGARLNVCLKDEVKNIK